jgi:tetratricopeptide (TPR) repeat protein
MKKFLFAVVLVCATTAFAQNPPTDQQQQGGGAIKIADQAEYNAFDTAMKQNDPAQKAAALESFLQQYPNSVAKEPVLEAMMAAYQQAQNQPKMLESSGRLLEVNPNHILALFVRTYLLQDAANKGQNSQANLAEASQLAQRGLAALPNYQKPEAMAPQDFENQKRLFAQIFNGVIGQAALANKDFPTAQKYLRAAVDLNPDNPQAVYPLALSYLTMKPTTPEAQLQGLFWIARTAALVPTFVDAIKAGKYYYRKYHGGEDGWDQLVALAQQNKVPPANLAQVVTPAPPPPSPADQAREFLKESPPEKMDFARWIFILTSGYQEGAQQVWNALQGKALPFVAKVIAADKDTLQLAVTADGFETNTAEVTVKMAEPYRTPPQVGSQVQMQATARSYTTQPSFMMTLDEGIQLDKRKEPAGKNKAKTKTKAKTKR